MKLIIVLLVISFLITGCTGVRTYTFKRDRVDQKMEEGNRGYIHGTPPPAESREGLKRTIIGVDVETPIMAWEEAESVKQPPVEEEKTIFEIPEKTAPMKIKGEIVEEEEEEEEEEEWIK